MSVALAVVGVSVLGSWGIATISLIVGGIVLLVAPGDADTTSSSLAVGIFLLITGLISGGVMQVIALPLMGLDPPLPVKAKSIVPHDRMKGWGNAGPLRSFPDGIAKEVRLRSQRVTIVRQGEEAYAMAGLCTHARLPLGSFPGAPIKPEPIRDGCVMCPFPRRPLRGLERQSRAPAVQQRVQRGASVPGPATIEAVLLEYGRGGHPDLPRPHRERPNHGWAAPLACPFRLRAPAEPHAILRPRSDRG